MLIQVLAHRIEGSVCPHLRALLVNLKYHPQEAYRFLHEFHENSFPLPEETPGLFRLMPGFGMYLSVPWISSLDAQSITYYLRICQGSTSMPDRSGERNQVSIRDKIGYPPYSQRFALYSIVIVWEDREVACSYSWRPSSVYMRHISTNLCERFFLLWLISASEH